jgi:hypothetical protein
MNVRRIEQRSFIHDWPTTVGLVLSAGLVLAACSSSPASADGGPFDGGSVGDAGVPADAGSAPDSGQPWLAYLYSPASRTLAPVAVEAEQGQVADEDGGVVAGNVTRLTGTGARITLDFGKEVGGLVTLQFAGASDGVQQLGMAFSESVRFAGPASDGSSYGSVVDGALDVAVTPGGSYAQPTDKLRGGFRFLTLFLQSSGWVEISSMTLQFTAAPNMGDLRDYPNYFYSNDDLLNRIWYAGAYTIQLDTNGPNQGRMFPPPASGWENNAKAGTGSTLLVDGAKRDRWVWPGDMSISLPSDYVSIGDLLSAKNSLSTVFDAQDPSSGELPYTGSLAGVYGSDTYHLWALVAAFDYFLFSADRAWLDGVWPQFQKAMTFSENEIDANHLLNVVNTLDWGRSGQGGENVAANALAYRTFTVAEQLATLEGDTTLAQDYGSRAVLLKGAINSLLWDAAAGAYRDNPTSSLHPQDGNALAVWFGVPDDPAKTAAILATLLSNWGPNGAHAPELGRISPFASGMELFARFAANNDGDALNFIHHEWGFMLNSPNGTGSTFWESYSDDGSLPSPYESECHGWGTGPTAALSLEVLGIQPTLPAGQAYQVVPHAGGLTHVEGRLTLSPGHPVDVSYDHPACGDFTLRVDSSRATGFTGVVGMPKFGQNRTIQINGVTAWDGSQSYPDAGVGGVSEDDSYIYFGSISPSVLTFTYFPARCP